VRDETVSPMTSITLVAYETRDVDTPLESLWGRQQTADLREQLLDRNDVTVSSEEGVDAATCRGGRSP
jgi:hypothetical protein